MSFLFFFTQIYFTESILCRLNANVLIRKNRMWPRRYLQSERCEYFKLESHSQSPIGKIKSFSSIRSNWRLPKRSFSSSNRCGIDAVIVFFFNGKVVTWMRPLCISGEVRKREGKVKRTSYVNGIKAERAEWGSKRRKDAKATAGYRWAMPGYFTGKKSNFVKTLADTLLYTRLY